MEPVLLALGQPPLLAFHVQRFLRVLIAGAPGYVGFESMKKYLQCQGMTMGCCFASASLTYHARNNGSINHNSGDSVANQHWP